MSLDSKDMAFLYALKNSGNSSGGSDDGCLTYGIGCAAFILFIPAIIIGSKNYIGGFLTGIGILIAFFLIIGVIDRINLGSWPWKDMWGAFWRFCIIWFGAYNLFQLFMLE